MSEIIITGRVRSDRHDAITVFAENHKHRHLEKVKRRRGVARNDFPGSTASLSDGNNREPNRWHVFTVDMTETTRYRSSALLKDCSSRVTRRSSFFKQVAFSMSAPRVVPSYTLVTLRTTTVIQELTAVVRLYIIRETPPRGTQTRRRSLRGIDDVKHPMQYANVSFCLISIASDKTSANVECPSALR